MTLIVNHDENTFTQTYWKSQQWGSDFSLYNIAENVNHSSLKFQEYQQRLEINR